MNSMTISLTSAWLLQVFLCTIRIGIVCFMTPMLGGNRLPARVRLLTTLALAVACASLLPASRASDFQTTGLPLLIFYEIVWGGLLAFGLNTAFASFVIAGRILDVQIGFGLANLVDPLTRNNAPLLGVALEMFAVVCFLAANGHHLVLQGLAKSLQLLPLGSSPAQVPSVLLVQQFSLMFTLGVVLASAVMVCLLLVDVGMGVAARVLPQANVFILSIPVKIFVGLSVLAMSIVYLQPLLKKIFSAALAFSEALLR